MKRICIVPARGGSKRLPGKNSKYIAGKPLFQHTLDAVIPFFNKTIFTTDCERMQAIAWGKNFGSDEGVLEVQDRPKELASDTSKVIDTVVHIFKEEMEKDPFDEIWLALPTCPLRGSEDVKDAMNKFSENYECDGILSITDFEYPPTLGFKFKEDGKCITDSDRELLPWQNGNTRSQDHKGVFRPNGCIYGMKASHFAKVESFYKGNILGYYMPREKSADIDTELDFKVAELMFEQKQKKL